MEEYWSWWSRLIYYNRYIDAPKPTYKMIKELVKNKDYFALTTNVEHQFQKHGFDKERLEQQKDMKVPSELIPQCPYCGRPLTTNLRSDNRFVQDDGWYQAAERYEQFCENHMNQNIVYLELGVGYNTPGIIKYPFWQMTMQNPNATYVCINKGEAVCPNEIKDKSICIDADINEVLEAVVEVDKERIS